MNDSYTWLNKRTIRPAGNPSHGRRWTSERVLRPDNAKGRRVRDVRRVRRPYIDASGNRGWTTQRVVMTDANLKAHANGHHVKVVSADTVMPSIFQRVKEVTNSKRILVPIVAGLAVAGSIAGVVFALRRKKKTKDSPEGE